MIEIFALENISYVLNRLRTEGYDNPTWSTKNVKRRTGLTYQFLYRLECRGIINPIERASNRRLIWTPRETYEMLIKIKSYLEKKIYG